MSKIKCTNNGIRMAIATKANNKTLPGNIMWKGRGEYLNKITMSKFKVRMAGYSRDCIYI